MIRPYVVLLPKRPGNPSDKHLVVPLDEYVPVALKERDAYTRSSEHSDLISADNERNHLNTQQERDEPADPATITTLAFRAVPLPWAENNPRPDQGEPHDPQAA